MRVIAWMTMALAVSPLAAQEKSANAVFEELNAGFMKAKSEYVMEAIQKGLKHYDMDLGIPAEPFVGRFEAAARRYGGTEDAVQFLSWIVQSAGRKSKKGRDAMIAAFDEIAAKHLDSHQLVELVWLLPEPEIRGVLGDERLADFRRRVLAESPAEVKSTLLYFSADYSLSRGVDSQTATEAALADLRMAAEIGGKWGEYAEGRIFELERLQIGMVAPDIVGPDIDGVEFKLSDYRGKVVVIDFWGDW